MLYDQIAGTSRFLPDPKLLTFDHGYLDIPVHVYPMKKYGVRTTNFVYKDLMHPGTELASNLNGAWSGRFGVQNINVVGFFSVAELIGMQDSSMTDESHALTHFWYPV